jgi:hypothetical protein
VSDQPDRDEEVRSIAASLRQIIAIVSELSRIADVFERCFNYFIVTDDMFREFLSEVMTKLNQIQDEIPDKEQIRWVTKELEQKRYRDHIRSLQIILSQQIANRDKLKEESAQYGINPPLGILNQIIGISVEIDKLESEIDHFRGLLSE